MSGAKAGAIARDPQAGVLSNRVIAAALSLSAEADHPQGRTDGAPCREMGLAGGGRSGA